MIRVALLVAGKDLRVERRSRVLLWQVVPFGVMALLLCGLALGPAHAGHSRAAPGLYFLVMLLVALLMINRSQAVERRPEVDHLLAEVNAERDGIDVHKDGVVAKVSV